MNTVYSLLFVSELISNPSSQSSVPTSLRASSLTETQRKVAAEAILRVAATKGYTTLDDLYKLTYTDLKKSGGCLRKLLEEHSFIPLIHAAFPDHEWKVWKFAKVPDNWWADIENQKAYLEDFAKKHNIVTMEDWYTIQTKNIVSYNGSALLRYYGGSLQTMLTTVFPTHDWKPWRFVQVTKGYWKPAEIRCFLEYLATKLNMKNMEEWYNVPVSVVEKFGGSILRKYNGSLQMALQEAFPEHKWEPWRFKKMQKNYRFSAPSLRDFFDSLKAVYDIHEMSDWYKITHEQIAHQGGWSILAQFKHNPYKALAAAYPEHTFLPWKFKQVSKNFWRDPENVRQLMQWIALELNFKEMDDWYSLTSAKLEQLGVLKVLHMFSRSPAQLVMFAYPDHDWQPWKFNTTPRGYWPSFSQLDNITFMNKFIGYVQHSLNVNALNDWYTVAISRDIDRRFRNALLKVGGLQRALQLVFPEHKWDPSLFTSNKKAQEKLSTYCSYILIAKSPTRLTSSTINYEKDNVNSCTV